SGIADPFARDRSPRRRDSDCPRREGAPGCARHPRRPTCEEQMASGERVQPGRLRLLPDPQRHREGRFQFCRLPEDPSVSRHLPRPPYLEGDPQAADAVIRGPSAPVALRPTTSPSTSARSIRAPLTIPRPRRSAKKGYGPFGYRFKRIARLAGARSDCEKVKNGGCKLRQNRRIGSARQLALVSGELEAIFECAVEAAKAVSQCDTQLRIGNR